MANLRLILGTMPFGGSLNEAQAHAMIKDWVKKGYSEVDTAIMYQQGKSEKILGKLHLCHDEKKVKTACKANPLNGFTSEKIVAQVNDSLKSLQVDAVDILYLHWPDHYVPIEDTLKGVHQLHQEGKFKEFGLSNYASWQVVDIYHICKEKGYVLPTVYQGMYNALTRDIELELIPALRKFGIRFYVYNPLAGGMLSGKYDFSITDDDQPKGRFFASGKGGTSDKWANAYRQRFWQQNYKTGIQSIEKVLSETYENKVSLLEASMRWLSHHSQLIDQDGIILGFSKQEHFQPNIDACKGEILDEKVVVAFDQAWNAIKSNCPKYNR